MLLNPRSRYAMDTAAEVIRTSSALGTVELQVSMLSNKINRCTMNGAVHVLRNNFVLSGEENVRLDWSNHKQCWANIKRVAHNLKRCSRARRYSICTATHTIR